MPTPYRLFTSIATRGMGRALRHRDFTLFALKPGKVKFELKRGKKRYVSIREDAG